MSLRIVGAKPFHMSTAWHCLGCTRNPLICWFYHSVWMSTRCGRCGRRWDHQTRRREGRQVRTTASHACEWLGHWLTAGVWRQWKLGAYGLGATAHGWQWPGRWPANPARAVRMRCVVPRVVLLAVWCGLGGSDAGGSPDQKVGGGPTPTDEYAVAARVVAGGAVLPSPSQKQREKERVEQEVIRVHTARGSKLAPLSVVIVSSYRRFRELAAHCNSGCWWRWRSWPACNDGWQSSITTTTDD
jgi:hypothetical protein